MKISVDLGLSAGALAVLKSGTAGHQLLFPQSPAPSVLVKAEPEPQLLEADIVFGQPDAQVIETCHQLKWIHVSISGITRYDNPQCRDDWQTVSNPTSEQIIEASNRAVQIRDFQWQQDVESKNTPVNFYGKIIDQYDNPIAGVKVVMNVRHNEYSASVGMTAKFPKVELMSDSEGMFQWVDSNVTGDILGISITKEGYILSPRAPNSFSAATRNFQNPAIIKMWKEGEKAQLTGGSHVFGIDSGKKYTLDLMTGKKFEGVVDGDLLVSITRPPDAKPRDKFAWSFSIEAIQGGFLEPDSNDEFMYVAPQSGYQPKIEMQFPNSPHQSIELWGKTTSPLRMALYSVSKHSKAQTEFPPHGGC